MDECFRSETFVVRRSYMASRNITCHQLAKMRLVQRSEQNYFCKTKFAWLLACGAGRTGGHGSRRLDELPFLPPTFPAVAEIGRAHV